MKRQLIQYSTLAMVLLLSVAFTGDKPSSYRALFQKIKAHMNPTQDHYVACKYAYFKDSLATKPTHTLQVNRWKVGDREVTQTPLMDVLKEGDKQLIIDKESKIIALGPLNPQGGYHAGHEMYLDSLLSGSQVQVKRNTGNTSTLIVNYPWSMPISASVLTFDHNSYQPRKASLYTRVPQQISETEWAIQPRIDIEYQAMEQGTVTLPVTINHYLIETEGNFQLRKAYQGYEFINQFND